MGQTQLQVPVPISPIQPGHKFVFGVRNVDFQEGKKHVLLANLWGCGDQDCGRICIKSGIPAINEISLKKGLK